ncbi:hypothetical protein PM8797T_07994 [Gimesia maris DSM 8797]|nr:hypothetical protein PM8797T_07994 [Gimesia maris DSM 8797]
MIEPLSKEAVRATDNSKTERKAKVDPGTPP